MATTLYLINQVSSPPNNIGYGKAFPRLLNGSDTGLQIKSLYTSRGTPLQNLSTSTVSGTVGDDVGSTGNYALGFMSQPLAADVTISGSITLNGWGYESSMSANVGLGFRIFKYDGAAGTLTQILDSGNGTEYGTTTAAYNWSATPTSTAFHRGDRILVVPYGDAIGTEAAAYTHTFSWNSPSSGTQGDSYVTFTENLTFLSGTPGGSVLYLTNNSAGISPGNTAYSAWTTPNSSYQYATTNTANGFTNPIQTTLSAGGSAVEWYTPQLQAFTLDGPFQIQLNASESNAAANVGVRCEVAITASDGSSATTWGVAQNIGELTTSDSSYNFYVAGDTVSVTDGQRIRFRFFFDDASPTAGTALADFKMVTGYTARLVYNASSATTLILCTETLAEYSAGTTYSGSFTADANISKNDIAGTFTADANISKNDIAGSFTADAYVKKLDIPGSFTADAYVSKATAGTFTADAYVKNTLSGTFTADAYVLKTTSGTFTADANIAKTTEGSFTADAYVLKAQGGTFTADAYVKKTTSGTFTADAYIKRTFVYGVGGGGTVAQDDFSGGDSVLAGTTADTGGTWAAVHGTSSVTGNQVRENASSHSSAHLPSVSLGDGDVYGTISGGRGFHNYQSLAQSQGITARVASGGPHYYAVTGVEAVEDGYAIIYLWRMTGGVQTLIGSLESLPALPWRVRLHVEGSSPTTIKVRVWTDGQSEPGTWGIDTTDNTSSNQMASGTVGQYSGVRNSASEYMALDDFLAVSAGGAVDGSGPTADAYISKTTSGSVTANAYIKNTLSGSFTADAYLKNTLSGSFTADAEISSGAPTTYSGSFSADAYISKTTAGSFTADANLKNTLAGSFTADAYVLKTTASTFTADAYISKTYSSTFTADAYVKNTIAGSVTADATIAKQYAGSFTADAYVKNTLSGSFTADAYIAKTYSGTFTADAYILKTASGSFTADANIQRTFSGTFTSDAYILKTTSGTLTADAYIGKTTAGSFTADAEIGAAQATTYTGSFTADAYIQNTITGTFTADAYVKNTLAGSFSADAYVLKTTASSFTADAYIRNTLSSSFTADAYVLKVNEGTFTADATIQKTTTGTFTADAYISKVGRIVWTSPDNDTSIDSQPVLKFLVPQATGNLFFHIELDTVNTFDSGDKRSYKSAFDQTNWEYYNGSTWLPVPSTGVPNTYTGNEVRFTVPSALSNATWYRRVRGGV